MANGSKYRLSRVDSIGLCLDQVMFWYVEKLLTLNKAGLFLLTAFC